MMKKTLLSIILALITFSFLYGQESNPFYLTQDGKKLGDTIYVWGEPNASEIVFEAIFHNGSDNDMNFKVAREQVVLLANTMSQFCWGASCYSPTTDTSTDYLFVPAGGSTEEGQFSGHYIPSGVIGTSIVKYTVYNMDNPDENVSIVCNYWASPEGIAEDAMSKGSVSSIYPNPAGDYVTIDYELTPKVKQASVRIFNLLGSTVREAVMEKGNNKLRINVSDLQNGVYFYSVLINGNIYKTKKLVIRR